MLQTWVLSLPNCVMANISTKSFQNPSRNNSYGPYKVCTCTHACIHMDRVNTICPSTIEWWGHKNGSHGGHLGFPTGTILVIWSTSQSTQMFPTKFQVIWPFGSGERIDFQDGSHNGHLGFWTGKILAIFEQLKEQKNRISRWPLDFWYELFCFLIYKSPRHFIPNYIKLAIQFRRSKIDFSYGRHGGHLGFLIGLILAIL